MQCPKCGALAGDEDLFCAECGQPLPSRPAAEVGKPSARPPDAAQASPTPGLQAPKGTKLYRLLLLIMLVLTPLVLYLAVNGWLARRGQEGPGGSFTARRDSPAATLLYVDGFEDPSSGWDTFDDGETLAGYVDGEYRLAVYGKNTMSWGNPEPGRRFSDVAVEVDARQVDGPLNNNYGLLVRYQEEDESFYWFQIGGDGLYSVYLKRAGEWTPLVDWQESNAIQQGLGATNRLKADCSGSRCVFYVNGNHLVSVNDEALQAGNVGLGVGTFDEAGVIVHFDNLAVYVPGD